jgi:hypothetical protein
MVPPVLIVVVACGSNDNAPAAGVDPGYQHPRTMAEICKVYCDNAAAHGCESALAFGGSCAAGCDFLLTSKGEVCTTAEKNHTGCLADVPNVCDAKIRDDYCLDKFCIMRHACDLPEPRCN